MRINENLYVSESKLYGGRGVFTREDLPEGLIIEVSPVIVIPVEEIDHLLKTQFRQYDYEWEDGCGAIALGYGSLYNHSKNASVFFEKLVEQKAMQYYLTREVKAKEELTIDYGQGYPDITSFWFDVK